MNVMVTTAVQWDQYAVIDTDRLDVTARLSKLYTAACALVSDSVLSFWFSSFFTCLNIFSDTCLKILTFVGFFTLFCWGFFLIEEQTTSIDDNNIYLMITIFNQIYF